MPVTKDFRNDSGQAAIEYLLLLLAAVVFVGVLTNQFIRPVFKRLTATVQTQIDKTFSGANLHQFRVGK